ncbi:hypothetical protein [Bradyrhizobium sp. TM233]|uniref:hypothetical protein n=1 Tax=Bradyrhizobium sp. TM233 TaxID=2599801 RepID=UPI0030C722CE
MWSRTAAGTWQATLNCGETHLKRLVFSENYVVVSGSTKQFSRKMKPFCAFGASRAKPPMVMSFTTNDGASPTTELGDKTMRALSFILAFGLVIAGSSFAGAPDGGLPGVGTFQYSGSPITPTASQSIVVAARF